MKELLKKVELYGEKSLSDLEILFVLFEKNAKDKVYSLYKDMSLEENAYSFLYELSVSELKEKYKFTERDLYKFKVYCEFAKRFNKPIRYNKMAIKSAKDVNDIFSYDFRFEKNEILKLVILNNKNIIKRIVQITNGKNDSVTFDIKSILFETIKTGYSKIILVHNHPSGDSRPSADDIYVTRRIKEATEIIGIKFLDHIIIGENEYTSIINE